MILSLLEAIRRNHGFEHASIAVLLNKIGTNVRLVGRSTPYGFYIYGDIPTDVLRESAAEALLRLQNGEADLAVSPLCGTNLAVTGLLAGLSSLGAMGTTVRSDRVMRAISAATVAALVSQPIGRLVQKYGTTSGDLAGYYIKDISRTNWGPLTVHWVSTGH